MTSGDGNATLNSHDENIGDPSATLHEQPSISLGRSIKQKPLGRGLRLEKLPSELRFAVLCSMPDLETLRSAIRASPVLYAQYRNNRDLVAKSCFHNQLSGLLPDAIGALMSRPSVIQSPRTNERSNDFLATYKSWLSAPSTSPNPSSLDTDAIRWLVHFHLHIVVPLSQEFSRWAMLNLSKEASFNSPAIDAAAKTGFSLSQSEQCRVMRAIYRTQIYHHLFGRNEGRRNDMLRYNVIQEIFFALFNPWETEIIASFDMYSREFYKKVFDEIAEDIHPDNPKNFHESGARISVEGWDFEYQ